MKTIFKELRKGIIKLKAENLDDLWLLSTMIEEGDLVKGHTTRKIKLGKEDERSARVVKKKIFVKLKVEKVEFSDSSLRILGTIEEGPDDIAKGSHQAITVEENDVITIIKEEWLKYQLDKIKEACEEKKAKILICIMDREEAYFALMKKYGYDLLTRLKGDVIKKGIEEKKISSFYNDVIKVLKEYDKKYEFDSIILASPAFWKEDLMKELKDEMLKKKITLATCSSCDEKAFNEVLKRKEVEQVLKLDRIAKEIKIVEKILEEICKKGKVAYGLKETRNSVNAGAVESLAITDSFIKKSRENGSYGEIERLMKLTEKTKGEVHIISSEHDGGKKLDGLGGIAALLRYKLEY